MVKITKTYIILGSVCIAIGIVGGFLIGWFSNNPEPATTPTPTADPTVSKTLIDEINSDKIEEYLEYLSEEPHIAGREVDEVKLVKYIKDKWTNFGFHVEVHPYEVLLSYPNQEDSNLISILLNNGSEIEKSTPFEKVLDETQESDKVVNPFTAYCGNGDVVGKLVYVNYGRVEDFIELTRDLGVDPAGHVCIARYGRIFRGSKASLAQEYGCTGLIIYSDPIDYTVSWDGVYPDSWFLPGTGAQRGNLQSYKGDPLTPQYPSLDTAWRMWVNETTLIRIPVTPIGYDDAVKYLEKMGGDEAPEAWAGGLPISYKLGPGFEGSLKDTGSIKMHITTKNELATTHNVFGYIEGSVEPDRYVLIGNHRDAWVFGAVDPSMGTAALMEMSRSIGNAVKLGWKPRRTIIFCSWGAEEYGYLGSTEWIEEFQKLLSSRSVAYLNLDVTVNGNYSLEMDALPNMNELLYQSAKLIDNPDDDEVAEGRTKLYDTWAKRIPKNPEKTDSFPRIGTLGAGSDFTPFVQSLGITAADVTFTYDRSLNIRSYPVYHSVYETFDLVRTFIDPGFRINKAVAQLMTEIARRLIDDPILPLNCVDYGVKLGEDKETFIDAYGDLLTDHGIDINLFDLAIEDFSNAAKELHARIDNLDVSDALLLRSINDQLMYLDRAFIDSNGIGERTNFKHVIYAPSLHNTYASSAFPGLSDSLFDIMADPDQAGRWREVERQYSILMFHIGSAASTLREVWPIKGHSNM